VKGICILRDNEVVYGKGKILPHEGNETYEGKEAYEGNESVM
jgi:hypothetical protein